MGMFSIERTITSTYTCPVCDASYSSTTTETYNMNGSGTQGSIVGSCKVCGWERTNKNGYTRNAIKTGYATIPDSAEPREGIQKLANNADISIPEAADVLNSNTETTLEDIQNGEDE